MNVFTFKTIGNQSICGEVTFPVDKVVSVIRFRNRDIARVWLIGSDAYWFDISDEDALTLINAMKCNSVCR